MRETLHWLPVRRRILYRVSTIAWRCILHVATAYLSDHLSYLRPVRVGDRFTRPIVVTISYHVLTRPLNRIGPSGPSIWNGLPLELRSLPRDFSSSFYSLLKTFHFARSWAGGAAE